MSHVEQRLIGMLMAQPERATEYPELERLMASQDHQRIVRVIRDLKTSDQLVLVDHMDPETLDYVRELAQPCWSLCPEMFPAYVRVLGEMERERAYAASVRRLRPSRNGTDPFKAI